jgi:Flp pilus assembly pilin Flp
MLKHMNALYRDEKGLTTVEWAVLVGIVAAIAVVGGAVVRTGISGATGTLANKLNNAVNTANGPVSW